jgi:hypothetical protein
LFGKFSASPLLPAKNHGLPRLLNKSTSSGLDFTAQALSENISTPNKELADSFRSAYGNTLKPHHGFLIKPIFNAAMSATPYRSDFFKKLGTESPESDADLKAWVAALVNQVGILKEFQSRKEAKW